MLAKLYSKVILVGDLISENAHALFSLLFWLYYMDLFALGFGVGSMVYCGLEFGELLEAREKAECRQWNALIVPLSRMTLTIAQIQFIFLNSQVAMTLFFWF